MNILHRMKRERRLALVFFLALLLAGLLAQWLVDKPASASPPPATQSTVL